MKGYKMMKIFKIMALWLAMAPLLLASCSDFLDITPQGQRKRDQLLETQDGIEDALYGVYATLRSESLYGSFLSISNTEVMAQYMDCYGSDGVTALLNYQYDDTRVKAQFEALWTDMYNNISNVNSVLTSELVANATEYPYSIYRGEALGLRAFMHFDLLRLFCEQITLNPNADGIPYATEFSLNTPDFIPAEAVYGHIIEDLLKAEELLADEGEHENETAFMSDRKIHFNLYAVQAVLARVYLTKGDKENALKYALKVIDGSGRRLSEKTEVNGDLAGVLSNNETIFGLYYAAFYDVVSPLLQQEITFSSLNPRSDIMNYYDANVTGLDYRSTAYFTATSETSSASYRLSKFTNVYELQNIPESLPSDRILGINLIRLPEMYYIAAECLLESDYAEAERLFNEVLTHRGLEELSNWPAPQNILTVSAINDERYRELIGEGQTFFNMKRQNLSISTVSGTGTINPSNNVYVVPVPDIEYDYRK